MKKVILRGPVFSRSGYGEHARFVFRSIIDQPLFDIYVVPTGWGQTGNVIFDDKDPDHVKMQECIDKYMHAHHNRVPLKFDISLQVCIPNELERMAEYNICITAGVETTKIHPEWIQKMNMIEKVITISEFSKNILANAKEIVQTPDGQQFELKTQTPVEVVGYPVREITPETFDFEVDTTFNFLTVCQAGPRKNLQQTIVGFVNQFFPYSNVGLILKINHINNSTKDFYEIKKSITTLLKDVPHRQCKVYILHGDLTDGQLASLYRNESVKALVSLSHAEGFGLPVFEAAINELPVVATNWSGYLDFLTLEKEYTRKSRKGNKTRKITKTKNMFEPVDFDLKPIHPSIADNKILMQNSQWAYPKEASYVKAMANVAENYEEVFKRAQKLAKHIKQEFSDEKMKQKMRDAIWKFDEKEEEWQKDLEELEVF